MALIKGKVQWAFVTQPNTKFEPTWSIDIFVANEDAAELEKQGIKLKTDKETGAKLFKPARKVMNAKTGGPNKAPIVVDGRFKGLPAFTGAIGNGSVCQVQYSAFEWNNSFGSGVGADLKGVKIIDLVEYAAPDGAEFEDDSANVTTDDVPFA